MDTKLPTGVLLGVVITFMLSGISLAHQTLTYPVPTLLAPYESGDKLFQKVTIKDKFIVYHHQRMLGEAIVEKDRIVYQFDMKTRALLKTIRHWREDIPDQLPPDLLSAEDAAWIAEGDAKTARLQFISPKSNLFHFEMTPKNPCWIVRTYDESGYIRLIVVDAVEGEILGYGVLRSYLAFSMAGAASFSHPCQPGAGWMDQAEQARDWFEEMGYPTECLPVPHTEPDVRRQIQSESVALFYEVSHSDVYSTNFQTYCGENVTAAEVHDWLTAGDGFEKMRFTFLNSCYPMCNTGPGTLEYEFRKGSSENTVVVGYCGLPKSNCSNCENQTDEWEASFFQQLSQGATVEEAFDQACADVPACLATPQGYTGVHCVCYEGDGNLRLVPTLARKAFVSWANATNGELYDDKYGWAVAWGDYDNDGDPDLYLANQDPYEQQGNNRLFKNLGGGSFVDVAGSGPLADAGDTRGAAWGDFDNDGDLDIYLANHGSSNKLIRNLENEGQPDTFEDVTTTAGLPSDQWDSWGVAWGDYDNDGHLDFFVANSGSENRLFQNNGDSTFSDVTGGGPLGHTGDSRGAAWGDYDNDGDLDLYLVNYTANYIPGSNDNLLYQNNNGTFVDVTSASGLSVEKSGNGMMASWGDYDNDEDLDLYVVNYYDEDNQTGNRLFQNNDGAFSDATSPAHGFNQSSGVAVAWGDYDNDGDLDIYAVNRYTPNRLYRNESAESVFFVNAATDTTTGQERCGSSVGWGDYDGDGDLDLYLANLGNTNRLFRNNSDVDFGNNWLRVELEGTESNNAGIGARVKIVVNGQSQIREISGGIGRAQNALTASFGLGSATLVDVLEVFWPGPSRIVSARYNVSANQVITIVEQQEPYPPECTLAFAQDQPSCPFICPAGDATYAGRAPIKLEVTMKDYWGDPIEGYDGFYVSVAPSGSGDFTLCCAGTQPTVQSSETMLPSAPTNADGKSLVDVFWGGGYDQALQMTCYASGGGQIGDQLVSRVRSADLNADCVVDQQDVGVFFESYCTSDWWADFNCDGWVNISDFAFLGAHNTHSCESQQMAPLSEKALASLLKKQRYQGSSFGQQGDPDKFSLEPNVPNPFNPATEVHYAVPQPGAKVTIEIFDVRGRRVNLLTDQYKSAGRHSVTWTGTDVSGRSVPSGVYFCRLKAPNFMEYKKMVLLK